MHYIMHYVMHYVMQAGSLKLLQALVQKGARLTAASEAGVTPLMVRAASALSTTLIPHPSPLALSRTSHLWP